MCGRSGPDADGFQRSLHARFRKVMAKVGHKGGDGSADDQLLTHRPNDALLHS
jgi:hypothetical protein